MASPLLPLLSTRRQALRAGFLAACGSLAAAELVDGRQVDARTPDAATRALVVGDSLTEGTFRYQADAFLDAGWKRTTLDAYRGRGIRTKMRTDAHNGLKAVDAIRGSVGDSQLWVVALGTNDAGFVPKVKYPDLIRQMTDRIGRDHYVMWVNIYLPANPTRQASWNAALADVADERPGEMYVYDWASLAAEHPTWMTIDEIHCTPVGYQQRAVAIADAARWMVAKAPPLRVRRTESRRTTDSFRFIHRIPSRTLGRHPVANRP